MQMTSLRRYKMPGMISHYLCGELTAKQLEGTKVGTLIQKHREIYNLGTQGPDFFFYYLPCMLKPKLYMLGNKIHTSNVNDFFRSLLINALRLKGDERASAIAYICGYITHYTLDANTHPYIYYQSGFKTKDDSKSKLHYSIQHRDFETKVDTLMLKLIVNAEPAGKRLWQLIHVDRNQAHAATKVISRGLGQVYDVKLKKKQIYSAMSSMITLTRVLQSNSGKRKLLLGAVEGLTMPEKGYLSSLIHDQYVDDTRDHLNLQGNPWVHPSDDPSETSNHKNHAFTDMFQKSVDDSVNLIAALEQLLHKDITLDNYLKKLGNRSFKTGQDCELNRDFLYHAELLGKNA